jgi:hypothetical protein
MAMESDAVENLGYFLMGGGVGFLIGLVVGIYRTINEKEADNAASK